MHYFDVLRRRWLTVVLCAALGAGSALAYLAVAPRQVTATAVVSMNVISTDPFNASRPGSALIDTAGEALVASSASVSTLAAESLDGRFTPNQIRSSIDVRVVSDSTILRIAATREEAEEAQTIADATAQAFLTYRSEQAQARIDRTLTATRDRVEPLREELSLANSILADSAPGSLEATQAETDRTLISSELTSLFDQAATLEAIDTTGGSIVSPALGNPMQFEPQRNLVIATGVLAGLGVGVCAAFAMNALAARIRDPQDVIQNGGRVVLGELVERRVTIPPTAADLDGFRTIRERMLADSQLDGHVGVCSVVDLTPAEHSDDVALNLAYVMAASGVPTEYVALGMPPETVADLTTALSMREDSESVSSGRRFVSDHNPTFALYLAPPSENLVDDEPISRAVREEIEARGDDVLFILRVPSGTAGATRLAAYRLSDTTVLLAGRGSTSMRQLAGASQELRGLRNNVLGTVLVHHSRLADLEPVRQPRSVRDRLART
ncbi:hypothetical protein [Ornithinimicrobium cavernae]|uniref:hypothetical protein n=1 Tax=Ornithinimicrobium cavernae TaxID=2666047 RepID=UPI0013794AFA|nr:hypothetical protein [Ornithinimicrobium cavernae]